ncbi:hypothetical protein GS597_17385 [Synechococcales cyanobacterium C]|uniref:Uncharacterized protein n=1 Tax=Petrachloros mirabilis ULC683 TaxID=2781853 RepID=A0A8K2A1S2_9CYAN|nr:hypothetical protein [Petrachloros mirabilis]NCJ08248.1 hypothetical protein [Petrachloros mirabilis ULC683]
MPEEPANLTSTVEEELDVRLPSGKSITSQRPVTREATASSLGKVIVWTFALSVAACFVVVFIEIYRTTAQSQDLSASFELFKTVSAVMSGPLGFVLGFYFRENVKP